MTQEEKAKAYDKALERARESLKDCTISQNTIDYLKSIFPELAESEDEKIRKEILTAVKEAEDSLYIVMTHRKKESWIAWLEKQKPVTRIEKTYDEALEKARKWYDANTNQGYREIFEDIFPELAEKDENIRKALTNWFKECNWNAIDDGKLKKESIVAWLEKQGEQKPQKTSIWKHWKDGIAGNGEDKPIYLIKDSYTYSISSCLCFECDYIELSELDKLLSENQGEHKPAEEIMYNPDYISPKDKAIFEIATVLSQHEDKDDSPLEKIRSILVDYGINGINNLESNEKKPTNKVEPKFHEGDWVTIK